MKMEKINEAIIRGTIISYAELFSVTKGDEYYKIDVEVKRLSGETDIIPVVMPRQTIDPSADYRDMRISLIGQVQTKRDDNGHLIMYVFTKKADIYFGYDDSEEDINEIKFTGNLKNKIIRKTNKRGIDIADVNFLNKFYYYPCIVWNENVSKIKNMKKNERVLAIGRFQSRQYLKEIDGELESKLAFELSLSDLKTA